MKDNVLVRLLEGERDFATPADSGRGSCGEAAVGLAVCCPMVRGTSRRLWPLGPIDTVLNVTRLGSQTWEFVEDDRVLAPDLVHITRTHELETILVIGHSGCDVVADAYDEYVAPDRSLSAGVETRIDPLVATVREALESDRVGVDCPRQTLLARLVEYTIARQVEFLLENEAVTAPVAGYVHDDDGIYGGFPETPYLVSLNGEQRVRRLKSRVPDSRDIAVDSVRN